MCKNKTTTPLLTTSSRSLTYPGILIEIEVIKCCALIDTGAGDSYSSSTLINHIDKKPTRTKTKQIKTLRRTNTRIIKIYSVKNSGHQLRVWLWNRAKSFRKRGVVRISNPKYQELKYTQVHLKDLQINDHYPKSGLALDILDILIKIFAT